jgi:hypothetical protein
MMSLSSRHLRRQQQQQPAMPRLRLASAQLLRPQLHQYPRPQPAELPYFPCPPSSCFRYCASPSCFASLYSARFSLLLLLNPAALPHTRRRYPAQPPRDLNCVAPVHVRPCSAQIAGHLDTALATPSIDDSAGGPAALPPRHHRHRRRDLLLLRAAPHL